MGALYYEAYGIWGYGAVKIDQNHIQLGNFRHAATCFRDFRRITAHDSTRRLVRRLQGQFSPAALRQFP